jgi:anti-sigma factor RsiW
MAAAIEAGARGEETGPTEAFPATGTQLLGGADVDATQALPATRAPRRAPAPIPTQPPARREERSPERASSGGGRAKWVALALILLLAAAGIAVLVSGTSGSGYTNIDEGSPRDQANELIRYIREHREE